MSDNPYVGPRPFRRGERLRGRDREARGLTDKLLSERVLLLHSPSGAGKTSLIQASVAPRLERAGFQICARATPFSCLRANLPPPREYAVRNRYVFSAVCGLLANTDPKTLADVTFAEALDRYRALGKNPRQAILFDQLEEVLALNPADREGQVEFFRQVGVALDDPDRWALFSIREDYMGGLDRFTRWLPTGLRARYRLDFLERRGALQAIREPANDREVDVAEDAASLLVDDLRTIIVYGGDGRGSESVAGPYIEPVQLQVVCHRLWRLLRSDVEGILPSTITADQVRPLLDVAGALRAYYADAIAETVRKHGVDERLLRDWFSTCLITDQGLRAQTRTTPAVSSHTDVEAVLRRLERRYLIRTDPRAGGVWYELSHDRMVEPVRADNARWMNDELADWQKGAAAWEAGGRRGPLLAAAELRAARADLATRSGDRIPAEEVERSYVDASELALADRSLREKANLRHRKLLVAVVVEAVVIVVLLLILVVVQ